MDPQDFTLDQITAALRGRPVGMGENPAEAATGFGPTAPALEPLTTDKVATALKGNSPATGNRVLDELLGVGDFTGKRFQTWPERTVRGALNAVPDAYEAGASGHLPPPGSPGSSEALIPAAQEMAAVAMPGGLPTGAPRGALGAGLVRRVAPVEQPGVLGSEFFGTGHPEYVYHGTSSANLERIKKEGLRGDSVYLTNHPGTAQEEATYSVNGDPYGNKRKGVGGNEVVVAVDKSHPSVRGSRWEADPEYLQDEDWGVSGRSKVNIPPEAIKVLTPKQLGRHIEAGHDYAPAGFDPDAIQTGPKAEPQAAPASQPFHSAVEAAIARAPQETMTPEQWMGYLRNHPGVKEEELNWMGLGREPIGSLPDFMTGNKPVMKGDLAQWAQAHGVQLEESVKGAPFTPQELETMRSVGVTDPANVTMGQLDQLPQDLASRLFDRTRDRDTKYSQYQLPGGENYGERVMTLPEKKLTVDQSGWVATKNRGEKDWSVRDASGDLVNSLQIMAKSPQDAIQQAKAMAERGDAAISWAKKNLGTGERPNFKSGHWDEPNVIVHTRQNDRMVPTEPGGEPQRSLFMEELQSDWHQKGRREGYRSGQKIQAEELGEGKNVLPAGDDNKGHWQFTNPRTGQPVTGWGWTENEARLSAAQEHNDRVFKGGQGVPDAPFKTSWLNLGMKRMLHEAATAKAPDGTYKYQSLSWTPGEVQAARYDLSKQINHLRVARNPDGTYHLAGETRNGVDHTFGQSVPQDKLADHVGKDLAEKIVKDLGGKYTVRNKASGNKSQNFDTIEEAKQYRETLPEKVRDQTEVIASAGIGKKYEGVDLQVGGEGMKKFYDEMAVRAANELGKRFGAKVTQSEIKTPVKENLNEDVIRQPNGEWAIVGEDDVPIGGTFLTEREALEALHKPKSSESNKVHVLPITPAMRQALETEGFKLFSGTVPAAILGAPSEPESAQSRAARALSQAPIQ